jgi:hypothetical protein
MIDLEVTYRCGCKGVERIYDDGKGNKKFKAVAEKMLCKKCFDKYSEQATEILSVEAVISKGDVEDGKAV